MTATTTRGLMRAAPRNNEPVRPRRQVSRLRRRHCAGGSHGFVARRPVRGNRRPSVVISEVHPAGSGNGTYAADWFEVTNTGTSAVDITGWKMDDNSNAFGSAVALRGVTSIPAGKSVVFFEGNATGTTDATIIAAFSTAWFGSATPPAGFLIGAYGGSGVGLSTSGDAVNLFDASGNRITGVSFGAATADRDVRQHGRSRQHDAPASDVSTLSVAGVNGAFLSSNGAETGSPGRESMRLRCPGGSVHSMSGSADSTCPNRRRTAPPPNSLLAQEVSAVTYNWDTDTLFVVGDGGTSIVQVTKTGQLIDSMTLAPGGSPQGTEFYDTGRAHLRRRRQVRHDRGARSAGRLVHLRRRHHA